MLHHKSLLLSSGFLVYRKIFIVLRKTNSNVLGTMNCGAVFSEAFENKFSRLEMAWGRGCLLILRLLKRSTRSSQFLNDKNRLRNFARVYSSVYTRFQVWSHPQIVCTQGGADPQVVKVEGARLYFEFHQQKSPPFSSHPKISEAFFCCLFKLIRCTFDDWTRGERFTSCEWRWMLICIFFYEFQLA